MNDYQRYIGLFCFVVLGESLLLGGLNFAIDPYGVLNSPKIPGLNEYKPEQTSHVRLFKAMETIRLRNLKMIFLGSSRTDVGLDPNHLDVSELQPAYNLGIIGSNMYETMRYFDHAIANQTDLKQIVIGLDFFMFNGFREPQADFDENRLNMTTMNFSDRFDVLFSMDALNSTWETFRYSQNRKGSNLTPYLSENRGRRTEKYFRFKNLPSRSVIQGFEYSLKEYLKETRFYYKYELSEDSLNHFQHILDVCQEKNIRVKVFISPAHVTQWEAIRLAGLWPVFEQWKRELVQMTPVWDFSGYNSMTDETIGDEMKNYLDSAHYTPAVGDLVLNRMFEYQTETVSPDFGVLINPENIESHLPKIRADREVWAKNNPDVVDYVRNLKP